MKTIQYILIITLWLISVSFSPGYADKLCDVECDFSITFPDGGFIQALEPVTIFFGSGGFIHDGLVATGYAADDIVNLAAGESLTFADGGLIDLGEFGNIDYSDLSINSNGRIQITAIGGTQQVSIYQINLEGEHEFSVVANSLVFYGSLDIGGDIEPTTLENYENIILNVQNTVVANENNACYISSNNQSSGSATITSGSGGSIALDSGATGSCSIDFGSIGLENNITGSNPSIIILPGTIEPAVGLFEPGNISQESISDLDGIAFDTMDGNRCTFSDGQCFSTSGKVYQFINGEMVEVVEGNGGLNVTMVLLLFLMSVFRYLSLRQRNQETL